MKSSTEGFPDSISLSWLIPFQEIPQDRVFVYHRAVGCVSPRMGATRVSRGKGFEVHDRFQLTDVGKYPDPADAPVRIYVQPDMGDRTKVGDAIRKNVYTVSLELGPG